MGLLVAAALYFWAPLVKGWVVKGEMPANPPVSQADANLPPTAAEIGAAQTPLAFPAEAIACAHPWTQLDQWMTQDLTTTPASDLPGRRDPFRATGATGVTDANEEAEREEAKLTPANLHVEVSSTVVGPRRRVALIAGKAYAEGEKVTVRQDDRSVVFELVEVHPRRVVLQREGKQFEVVIPDRKGSGRIEMSGDRS